MGRRRDGGGWLRARRKVAQKEEVQSQVEALGGVDFVPQHIGMLGVFLDHIFHNQHAHVGFGDLEVVFDGNGHIQWPFGFW